MDCEQSMAKAGVRCSKYRVWVHCMKIFKNCTEWEIKVGFYFFHVGVRHKVDKQARSSPLTPLLLSHSLLRHPSPTHSTRIQSSPLTSYLVIPSYSILLSHPPLLHTYSVIPSYCTQSFSLALSYSVFPIIPHLLSHSSLHAQSSPLSPHLKSL